MRLTMCRVYSLPNIIMKKCLLPLMLAAAALFCEGSRAAAVGDIASAAVAAMPDWEETAVAHRHCPPPRHHRRRHCCHPPRRHRCCLPPRRCHRAILRIIW